MTHSLIDSAAAGRGPSAHPRQLVQFGAIGVVSTLGYLLIFSTQPRGQSDRIR